MSKDTLRELLKQNPVICAVKSPEDLEKALICESTIVFVLFGDILSIQNIILQIKEAGKLAFVHIDLIEGFSSRDVTVDFLAKNTTLSGIISTKSNIIRCAKENSLFTVHRFFVFDSKALINVTKQLTSPYADVIEILPGIMPNITKELVDLSQKPIIASGLINEKKDVLAALNAGAISVSSTNNNVWFL